jgi:hypothetical protein
VTRVRETFELNQLKSGPSSQLLPVFDRISPVAKLVAINLDRPISYIFIFQVPANFFFIVMTTGQELVALITLVENIAKKNHSRFLIAVLLTTLICSH